MQFHLAFVLLGPLFYAQGKYARLTTPKLPEPEGSRQGVTGQGQPLSVLISGDSAAAGVGVDHQHDALSGSLVSRLSCSHNVSWKLCAHTGDQSSHLLEKLSQMPAESFDLVVISIGVNDVTTLTRLNNWLSNIEQIHQLLCERYKAKRIYFTGLPPMHLCPALPNPLRWWLGLRARQLDLVLQAFAEEHECCEFISIPFPLQPGYVAVDGFHPGPKAYQLWSDQLVQKIRQDLASNDPMHQAANDNETPGPAKSSGQG